MVTAINYGKREASSEKSWNNIPAQSQTVALVHIKFYLDDFIGVCQGDLMERSKMTYHLFH